MIDRHDQKSSDIQYKPLCKGLRCTVDRLEDWTKDMQCRVHTSFSHDVCERRTQLYSHLAGVRQWASSEMRKWLVLKWAVHFMAQLIPYKIFEFLTDELYIL